MEEHKIQIVVLINKFLDWLFSLVGIHGVKLPDHLVLAFITTIVIILFFTLIQFKYAKRWVYYHGEKI